MHQAPTGRKVEEARVHEARIHEGAIAPENAPAGIARLGQVVQTRRVPLADLARREAHESLQSARARAAVPGVEDRGEPGEHFQRDGGEGVQELVEVSQLAVDGAERGAEVGQGGPVAVRVGGQQVAQALVRGLGRAEDARDVQPAHEAAVGRADGGEVGVQGGEGGRGQAEERAGGVVEGQELEADGARDGAQGGAAAELPAPGVGEVARVVDDERVDPVAQLAGQVREAEVERGCCVTVERDFCGHGVEAVGRASSVESLGRLVMMLGRVGLYENETRVLQSHMRERAVAEAQPTRSSSYGKMCDEVMDSVNQAVTA
ncbi:hypothetical protein BJ546DRAFT_257123 [Cryomyces antarcticus]